MGKTNFMKVEEALVEGLRQMTVSKLLKEVEPSTPQPQARATDTLSLLIASLRQDFKWFVKKDPYFIPKLEVEKESIQQLLKQAAPYTHEQIAELEALRIKIEKYKKSLASQDAEADNERLVEEEIKRQKNKRFNIRDEWLPLH